MGMLIHRHLTEVEIVKLPEEPIQEVETVEQKEEIPEEKPKTTARKTETKTRKPGRPAGRKRTVK